MRIFKNVTYLVQFLIHSYDISNVGYSISYRNLTICNAEGTVIEKGVEKKV